MVTRALSIALALAAGCTPTAGTAPATTTTEMKGAAPAEPPPAVEEPEPTRRGFDTREPELADRPGAVALSLLARGGLGAELSPDGETILVIRGRGGLLMSAAGGGKKRRLPRRRFVHSRFAPDGAHVALMDDRKRVTVVDTATGKKVAEIERAERPRWIDAATIAFKRGCTSFRYALAGGQPQPIGSAPKPCGKVVRSSADGTRWWIARRGRYRRGVLQTYKGLTVHSLADRRRTVVLSGTDDAHFMMPEVSADGGRVCYVDALFDLFCKTGQNTPERIWHNARRPIRLHDSGRWLLFAVGKHTSPDSKIGVVDFETRTITLVPRAGRQWWRFLAGGQRIAGDGGSSSAMVYDLDAGWKSSVGDARSEWEGLYPAPDRSDRFVVGRERGGTRDLYLVTIE
jgi:hypothetical protein